MGLSTFQEIVEKYPIMDECLTKFFRLGASAPVAFGNATRRSVVGNYRWMVDRQIRCALLEIGYRVTAFFHHLRNELIRFLHGAAGVIDEAALNARPTFLVRAEVLH